MLSSYLQTDKADSTCICKIICLYIDNFSCDVTWWPCWRSTSKIYYYYSV